MIIGPYEQAIEDTVPGCMVPCDEQRTKRGICFPGETGLLHSQKPFILSLFARDRREGISTYKRFILKEIGARAGKDKEGNK